jgi:hypothetical protein
LWENGLPAGRAAVESNTYDMMLTVLFQFTVLSLSVVPALNAVEVADLHKRVAKFNSGVKGKPKFGDPGTP